MQKTWSYQQNRHVYFYYYLGWHTNWWPTSPEHVTHPFCNRPSWQVRPTSPTLPLWSPSGTATLVPTFQTKCYPNVHTITPISQSQRYSFVGKSHLVAPSHPTFVWKLLSCTHSFYYHGPVSRGFINWSIHPPHLICLTKFHSFTLWQPTSYLCRWLDIR